MNPPIHIDGTVVEKVDSFKFRGVHITGKLKWFTHTDKRRCCPIFATLNLRRLKKFGLSPKTLKLLQMHNREHPVGLHHRLVRQLLRPQPHGSLDGSAVCTTHHRGQTTCPPGYLQHPISLPVHPIIIQKARSVQLHQSWDRDTEKQLQSQGHQTVKQPSLTEWLLPTYRLKYLATLIKLSLVTLNNATLIMSTYPTLLNSYLITIIYTIYCILPIAHPYIYMYIFIPLHVCVYKVVIVNLLDITALSELEAQEFCYTCINIC